jgi:urease accessory protein
MNATFFLRARRGLISLSMLLAAGVAQAHPGHGAHGLTEGLAHPLGLDHLLAMVAVGMWSAAALPARRALMGPAVFVLALLAGAAAGLAGVRVAGTEALIATSVVLFGVLLAGVRQWSAVAGLSLVAASAVFHGLAHGAELPVGASAIAYVGGFVLSTLVLHVAGLGVGTAMRRAQLWTWRAAGGLFGAAGLLMLARV